MATKPTLLLVHEPETACRARLEAQGIAAEHAFEISSYLAQSTDLEPEFPEIERECAALGLAFRPVELDMAADAMAGADPRATLVWTLTDGIAYFRGGASPALARLHGLRMLGSDDALFALCQDKFRSGAVLRALGMPVPEAGFARDGRFLVDPPPSADGWFVKPNRLGAKIGIWQESRCFSLDEALALSRRIFSAYRDDALVQAYVPGRNARASFLAVEPGAGAEALVSVFVDSGGDFQTMGESLALYGETGAAARAESRYAEPELTDVAATQPAAPGAIRSMAPRLTDALGLRDVFSLDLRIEDDGRPHLIEFEVCPGLPCFDFRDYCRRQWNMTLSQAMAQAAVRRLGI
jgi:D-alanine-D-alanine ligase-like ATP-grasp enzyme